MAFKRAFKRLVFISGCVAGGAGVWLLANPRKQSDEFLIAEEAKLNYFQGSLPSRAEQLKTLEEKEYDVLVIGGGATGCGVALDAVTRGLSTAMVEKFDFASGTSSRSTKLIHGGVRYLQKAILRLDIEQYRMVKEALAERGNLLKIAPHLAQPLPIMLPVYRWWQLPYYYMGIKAYDLVAGRELLKWSYFILKSKALELFPMLKSDQLVGAIVYYDGQHDDARMCLSLALTATRYGASVANHAEVVRLLKRKTEDGKEVLSGAVVRDTLTGKEIQVKAKCVVNATGPYTDFIRQLDDGKARKICQPSSGVHIVLPNYYSPSNMGLLDPSTSDGRVIFFLPWLNSTMAGTTDIPCEVTDNPSPTEAEVQFILKEIKNYLNPDVNVRRGDVLSTWSGIRPLVVDPNAKDTQSIARNHIINVSESNLVTIAGGKWTTYRHMAEETVDKCIEVSNLEAKNACLTKGLLLDGAHNWTPTLFIRLIQDFGLDNEVAQHLARTYGDKSFKVAELAQQTGKRWPVVGKRLHEEYPFIEAEVMYAVKEYAETAIDVLARRTRLSFLNVQAAEEVLPRVIEIMSKELGWSKERAEEELNHTKEFLSKEMGLRLRYEAEKIPLNFTKEEVNFHSNQFKLLDADNRGFITVNDLKEHLKESEKKDLNKILGEIELNKNAQIDRGEFLQLMSVLEHGPVTSKKESTAGEEDSVSPVVSIARSGGGL